MAACHIFSPSLFFGLVVKWKTLSPCLVFTIVVLFVTTTATTCILWLIIHFTCKIDMEMKKKKMKKVMVERGFKEEEEEEEIE